MPTDHDPHSETASSPPDAAGTESSLPDAGTDDSSPHSETASSSPSSETSTSSAGDLSSARARLARAQHGLLSSLVADGPDPDGFDTERLEVQRRALLAKRADVVAKVAPELPRILGPRKYRAAYVSYARGRPLPGGYRRDALAFAEWLLRSPDAPRAGRLRRLRLHLWWRDRAGPRPLLRLPRRLPRTHHH